MHSLYLPFSWDWDEEQRTVALVALFFFRSPLSHWGSATHWLGWWQFRAWGSQGREGCPRAQLDDNSEVHAPRQSKPLQENLCWQLSLESTLSINSIPLVRGNWSWESERVQDRWAFGLSCRCWILVMSSEPHVDGLGETLFCSRLPSGLPKDRLF